MIINADDFGFNEETNRAIMDSFLKRLCSSTTIMPNMPGFEHACYLTHENGLTDRIGMHLVLADGFPLTDPIKSVPKFCNENGELNFSQARPTFRLDRLEKEVLAAEIRAQIAKCRHNGIPLTHMDSHYHIHNQWGIVSILIPILHEVGIPYLRLTRNCGSNLGVVKRMYKGIFNRRLRREGLARTQYFGALPDYQFLIEKKGGIKEIESFELLTHPQYDENGILIDRILQRPLEQSLRQALPLESIQKGIP